MPVKSMMAVPTSIWPESEVVNESKRPACHRRSMSAAADRARVASASVVSDAAPASRRLPSAFIHSTRRFEKSIL